MLDAGRITDGRGQTVDASHALFILTSNHLAKAPRRAVGFGARANEDAEGARDVLKGVLRPELLGRLDGVIQMRPLEQDAFRAIAGQLLGEAVERLARRGLDLEIGEGVSDALASAGDKDLGARPIRAKVESDIIAPSTQLLLKDKRRASARLEGSVIRVDTYEAV